MPVQLVLIFTLPFVTFPFTEAAGYFTYTHCPSECINQNLSCTISTDQNDFLKQCIVSTLKCTYAANRLETCLRLDLPPIGGELLWLQYKKTHRTPDCQKIRPSFLNRYALMISSVFSIVFFCSSIALSAILIQRIRSTRIRYQRINIPTTPLPASPDFPPNPYQSTTTQIE